MRVTVAETLEWFAQRKDPSEVPYLGLRQIEFQLALAVADCAGEKTEICDRAVEKLLRNCFKELPLADIVLKQEGQWVAKPSQKLQGWFAAQLRRSEGRQRARAEQIIDLYRIDEELVGQAAQAIEELDQIYQHGDQVGSLVWMEGRFPTHSMALLARSIFVGLSRRWNQEESSEPLLWKTGAVLESLARNSSYFTLQEALGRLSTLGLSEVLGEQEEDPLRDFVTQANEDVNGNLLDNLVLAHQTYRDLMNEGWQPDRWEIENLPMTVDMYLRYMEKAGIKQVGELGSHLTITLSEAQEAYRYSGSPFSSSDENKEVIVVAPGWLYRGDVVVRPKVREVAP